MFQMWKETSYLAHVEFEFCFGFGERTLPKKFDFAFLDECYCKDKYRQQVGDIAANTSNLCTALIFDNQAQPYWLSVPCHENLATDFVCQEIFHLENSPFPSISSHCPGNTVRRNHSCLGFVWKFLHHDNTCSELSKTNSLFLLTSQTLSELHFVTNAVSSDVPPFFSCQLQKVFLMNKYVWSCHKFTPAVALAPVLVDLTEITTGLNVQKCSQGFYFSSSQVCGSTCNENNFINITCEDVTGKKKLQDCPALLFKTNDGACKMFLGQIKKLKTTSETSNHKNKSHFQCSSTMMPFHLSDLCILRVNVENEVLPCTDGSHLSDCWDFTCNTEFKCPQFYCIPWNYVCDGKWHCPGGTDELNFNSCGTRNCSDLFKCHKSQICIHLDSVCDGNLHCPFGDDETLCSLSNACPTKCQCVLFAIRCFIQSTTQLNLHSKEPFVFVSLESSFPDNLKEIVQSFAETTIFYFIKSKLTDFCNLLNSKPKLIFVDMSQNQVEKMDSTCFAENPNLMSVILDTNLLTTFDGPFQKNLKNLTQLSLSHNLLTGLDLSKLQVSLKIISVCNTTLSSPTLTSVKLQLVQVVQTDDARVCCFVQNEENCTAVMKWYKSCKSLLPNVQTEVIFYVLSLFILISNSLSILLQALRPKSDKNNFAKVVVANNAADIVCCIPLFVLWIADLVYKEGFTLKQSSWQASPFCWISSFFILSFSFLSPSCLCLMSLTRYKVVAKPMTTKFKEKNFLVKWIAVVVTLNGTVAALITGVTRIFFCELPSQLCSPFLDPTKQIVAAKVCTWMSVICQMSAVVFIFNCYIFLVKELKKSQNTLKGSASKEASNQALFVQIVIITSSNIICWIPSLIIHILSMFLEKYSVEMVLWVSVAVTPLNSLVNPVVFIVTTLRK